ncbi:eukaryotic translation initiation factor 5B-like [Corylus avellana]|uniref:eukaryotic translation initiation factor 5B-like n=1 Tax=Corylus avellana TaxID=13451 RepID=UPI00286C85D6|nr:eukaryotic translation initiation factor 5B-like [Corylus avellana]XP_059446162.1 eukaryotic translation initiation factor 5B-like [Corylus avellana]XP_059446168.1 eukaryotic translation initiation factor 5B-like [Corylus avellana]
MGRKKPTARGDDENASAAVSKSKKKSQLIDDDEYSIGAELAEEPEAQEDKVVITGKKKGKKGNAKAPQPKDDDDGDGGEIKNEDEEVHEVVFGGKKGKSKKGGGNNAFGFGLLGEEEEEGGDDEDGQSGLTGEKDSEEDDEEQTVSFSGKKKKKNDSKKSGGSLFTASAFDAIDDDEEEAEVVDKVEDDGDNDDEPVIAFTGKKKSTKGGDKGSVFTGSAFDGLGDDGDEDEDVAPITFSGKKKSSKSSKTLKKAGGNAFSAVLSDGKNGEEAVEDEDVSAVAFSGKKKSSKKKGSGVFSALGDGDEVRDVVETEQLSVGTSSKSEEVKDTSKNKKKKKKSGRTAEEEDDLDKILAELGEGPTVSKPAALPPQEEKLELQPETIAVVEEEVEEENVESAAAKKKKKKKEKEKEKKAAAAAAAAAAEEKQDEVQPEPTEGKKNEVKSKGVDKKLPKHVREMQEALARRKEAEERKKREDEERLRKEEEERRRLEELERQAEEVKRKKKEKEKEKLQRKKAEGKLLTTKQREEARRLEAMRNQILANAGVPLPSADTVVQTKRPKYQNKKQKPIHQQANGAGPDKGEEEPQETVTNMDSLDSEKVDEESMDVEEESVVAEAAEENGLEEDDDEDEWDAKSWDDVAVNLSIKSAFADEEADSEPERVVRRETKGAVPTSRNAAPPATAKKTIPSQPSTSQPSTSQNLENKRKDADLKKEVLVSEATSKHSEDNLRSPICCIMGHVDTGKTKLLDCIRGTNVQEGEAGGITQQIGATYFPAENIRERTKELKADAKLKVPGLLVIDTPGHESFTNLRSRGSGLCDIAILVVDIMHGLEPQTIESLNLLKMRNTEFIVALNKVDRLYGWKVCRNAPIVKAMKQQSKDVQNEFNMRLTQIITQFKEQGLNTELYYKNKEMGETFSIVPTSAISGEGIPDLLLLLVQWTQKTMVEKLTYSSEMQCTVLEVKVVEGHGTTIDVVLVNGVLHEGDQIVVCGMQGPIVTSIRALLTPHPMKELRVKGTYLHHKKIKAAMGIKITAQGLEHAIAGTGLYVVGPDDNIEDVKDAAMEDMKTVMSRIDKSGEGVYVQASTLGSLEALLEFLKSPAVNIPVSGIGIGPVHKKDVMKASVMLEKKKEYATILAFDVKVTPEARELSDELGVKIFIADIIYHLFDQFKAYIDNLKEEKKKEAADDAVFPCVLKIMPNCIFNKKDPIVLGVDIVEGIAKVGTPICVPQQGFIDIGRIASIENNHKPVDIAKKGQKVAIKIVGSNSEEQQKMFGRHFEVEDELVSHISRKSIDVLKANYRDDLSIEEWKLVAKLKTVFKIQ